MALLHAPDSVFSWRHTPTWLMLCAAAGAVNAIAFIASASFVTHLTGNVSRIGLGAAELTLALEGALVLGCFVLGAITAALLLQGRSSRGRRPLYAAPLLTVSALLTGVAIAGLYGAFGPLGEAMEGRLAAVFVATLAFAMGLQNAAVTATTGFVRTAHLTGPATDLGIHVVTAFYARGDQRRDAARHAALRLGKIITYTLGAAIGAVLVELFGYAAFFGPAAVVFAATLLSFVSFEREPQLQLTGM